MPPAFTPVIKMTLLAIWEEKVFATVLASVSAPNSSWLAILEKIAVVTWDEEQGRISWFARVFGEESQVV